MLGGSRSEGLKENAARVSALPLALARDKRFRKRLVSAIAHGAEAGRRMQRGLSLGGALARLAADRTLLRELRSARSDLEQAYSRLEAKGRSHKLRNVLVLTALAAAAAAVPQVRTRLRAAFSKASKRYGSSSAADPFTRSSFGDAERPDRLEDLTREELYARAEEADIPDRSEMSKEQLIEALRARS